MMTPFDDDLLTALLAARPDAGYQPSATSPEARAMLARIVAARPGDPRLARRWWRLAVPGRSAARGLAAPPRHVVPVIMAVAATAGLVVAGLILRPASTSGASPAAVHLLARIAAAASAEPSPLVRDSQFSYTKVVGSSLSCDGNTGTCVLQKPDVTQIWVSVSNECITGLERADGVDTPLVFNSNYLHCPYQGSVNDPTYRFLQSLPTEPQALLSLIERQMAGQLPRPEEAFTTIGDILNNAIVPPQVSAALYRAAALIPGVTVVADATDAIGRHGVAVAFTYLGERTEWIFSKQTLQYLGRRGVNLANDSSTGSSAVLQRAFVDHAGQVPG